jgi:hypothetical protein
MEQLDYNLLFRWFVGLNMDDSIGDVTVFTKNRERLLDGDIAEAFFQAVLQQARERSLLSDEHFTVDGTLLEAWASGKSYPRKDAKNAVPPDDPGNATVDFHGEKRSNQTHESKTDPDAKMARKGKGKEAKLSYNGNLLVENRNGLINVFPIQLPALRERVSDISLLVEYLIDRYAQKAGKRIRNIDKKTMELFHAYDWPGNIRELQNVVERAVILCEGETFFVDEAWLTRVAPKSTMTSVPLVANLAEHEKEMLEAALRESEGVVGGPTGAAVKLGIPRQTLESKIRKLGINRYRFKAS